MNLTEMIAVFALVLILGGAVFYIIKAKKSGKKCIGCPDSAGCAKSGGCHACQGGTECECDKKHS